MNAKDLTSWSWTAKNGEAIVYHRGFLAADREEFFMGLLKKESRELDYTAKAAMGLAEKQCVHLVQKLTKDKDAKGRSVFEYIAVRRGANV